MATKPPAAAEPLTSDPEREVILGANKPPNLYFPEPGEREYADMLTEDVGGQTAPIPPEAWQGAGLPAETLAGHSVMDATEVWEPTPYLVDPRDGTLASSQDVREVLSVKEALHAQPKCMVYLADGPNSRERRVNVQINGYTFSIPSGRPWHVPQEVYLILIGMGEMKPNRDPKLHPADWARIPKKDARVEKARRDAQSVHAYR